MYEVLLIIILLILNLLNYLIVSSWLCLLVNFSFFI